MSFLYIHFWMLLSKFSIQLVAPARVGLVAPIDVVVPPGNTGLDPSQTVRKQKFFFFIRSFFFSLDLSLDLCQGLRWKGNNIFIWISYVSHFFGNSLLDNWTPLCVFNIHFSLPIPIIFRPFRKLKKIVYEQYF